METAVETRSSAETGPGGQVAFWESLIKLSLEDGQKWRKDGNRAINKYRGTGVWNKGRYDIKGVPAFNILYSNVETLRPSIFSATPQPIVQRKFKSKGDPNERQVAVVLQRCLEYYQEEGKLREEVDHAIDDYLLPGRGSVRVYLENQMGQIGLEPIGTGEDGEPQYDREPEGYDEQGMPYIEDMVSQDIGFQYVHWEDLVHDPVSQWNEVKWIAFKHMMTRDELVERFGEAGEDVGLTHTDIDETNGHDDTKNYFAQATVWEIWDKIKRKRIFIAEAYSKVLEEMDDPYGLKDFFPIPEPLFANRTNETLNPVSDYYQYRKQADELEVVSDRIMSLTRSLKAVGIYASDQKDPLGLIETAKDGQLVPVENWASMVSSGGLGNVIEWWPIETVANVLMGLIGQRDVIKQQIYEITGISDLFRGVSEQNVTATAEKMKGEFGSMRLRARQALVQRFVKDLYVIAAELVAEHSDPAILSQMTGEQVTPEMMGLMKNDKLRGYAIDVETDSTIAADEQRDKAETAEFVQSMVMVMQLVGQAKQTGEDWALPLLGELGLMTVRSQRKGRGFEDKLEQLIQTMETEAEQAAQQPPQEQPPSPEEQQMQMAQQEAQAKMQADQAKMQMEAQAKQAEAQVKMAELQMKNQNLQKELEIKEAEIVMRAQETANKIRLDEDELTIKRRESEAKIRQMTLKSINETEARRSKERADQAKKAAE